MVNGPKNDPGRGQWHRKAACTAPKSLETLLGLAALMGCGPVAATLREPSGRKTPSSETQCRAHTRFGSREPAGQSLSNWQRVRASVQSLRETRVNAQPGYKQRAHEKTEREASKNAQSASASAEA